VAENAVGNGAARRGGLAQRRKALGLTQEQLADLLNVNRTTVARWERGQAQPLPWQQPKLARALKFPPNESRRC
jgi:transcriptional regulator with XRE-family HTH domain